MTSIESLMTSGITALLYLEEMPRDRRAGGRMGYGPDDMTAHGFRSTASSLLNESGKWSADAIERALSPADGNQVRAAYHRGAHWPERVEMAQWWSDHIDTLKAGAKVLPLSSECAEKALA